MPRPRTPTKLKIIKGTAQKCRTNKAEPNPGGSPVMPEYLTAKERKAWDVHFALLKPMGVLTVSDSAALAVMCGTYVEMMEARETVQLEGSTILTERGVCKHPAVAIAADAEKRYHGWAGKFGLTPADRTKVSATAPAETVSGWGKIKRG